MSKLGRFIQRRRQSRGLSASKSAVYRENGETATGEQKNSEIPINELLAVETDTSLIDLTEIRGPSGAARAMRMDLSSYRAHKKGSRGLTVKSEKSYAEFFNFEWSMTGNREDHDKLDGTSIDISLGDKDFELVLRHFWKHLDAEKRRKLIQLAASLVDGDRKEQ